MAICGTLKLSRKLPCKGGVSGIKAIGLADFINPIKGTEGQIKEIPTTITKIYRYELKHTGNVYSEEIATDEDARSNSFNGTLTVNLQKLDVPTRNELITLVTNEVHIFVEMNNGDILLIGGEFGASLTGGSITTGGNKVDFNGYVLTFTTSEAEPLVFLDGTAKTKYATLAK